MTQKLNERQIDISSLTLSEEQQALAQEIEETTAHFFVTGKAGTGKSVLLQHIKQTSKKQFVVVAPTGVAALNVGGQTIHSLFKIPPSFIQPDSLKIDAKTIPLLKKVEMVIVDEISMVRCDLMDAIDSLLRQARGNSEPFGGVQMVVFGDLYQLPPVITDPELKRYFQENNDGFYFFNAHAWQGADLQIRELKKIFRQSDEEFIHILNAIRVGDVSSSILQELNDRTVREIPQSGVVTLATTNSTVAAINTRHLSSLADTEHLYTAVITGTMEESSFPTEKQLRLKKQAQVMFLKNDKDKRWANGSIGVIEELGKDEIRVSIDGTTHTVTRETWNKIRYLYNTDTQAVESETVSSFTQFPLRLAWAITIHKSQGQTYGSVVIDLGSGAFSHGQSYVALSRCRSLEGLYLKRAIYQRDIIVDPAIVHFMSKALRR